MQETNLPSLCLVFQFYGHMLEINQLSENHRDKLFKSGHSGYVPFKLLKGCLPQNVLSPLLSTLYHFLHEICLQKC